MNLTMKSVSKVLVGVLLAAGAQVMGATAMPKIISHRGESKDRPENTLAAFRLAVERGVDAIECDVYTTTDGVPVIIHDSTTGRTAGEGTNLTVTASTWDDLKDVKVTAFGSWATSDYADETIPKFADYLALLEGTSVKAVVEIKGAANSCVARVVEAIQAQPAATADRVIFISFTADIIRAVRTALPDYPAYLLLSSAENAAEILPQLAACNATGVDISYSAAAVNADDIAAVKAAGYAVATWTVDNINTAVAEAQMGVDAITTNKGGEFKVSMPALLEEGDRWLPRNADSSRSESCFVFDVGDYVQDGLVAHFDGIRNAGATVAHDATATTWKNLCAGPDATFRKASGDTSAWSANGYEFKGRSLAQMQEPGVALGTQCTIQLATTLDYRQQETNRWPNLFAATNDFCLYYNNKLLTAPGTELVWKTEPYAGDAWGTRPVLKWTEGTYLTGILDESMQYLFTGTSRTGGSVKDRTKTGSIPALCWTWGGSGWGTAERYLKGTIHSVRLYNRPLTEDELVQNRTVDDFRFRGIGGNVVVQANLLGVNGVETNGLYCVNGVHVFTAPEAVTVEGATYSPVGYTLEGWNAATNVWQYLGAGTTTTFAYTNCVARPKVRLTWLLEMTAGQRKLDADAYASYAIFANWDGIRNAGLDAAHNATATSWSDLVGGATANLGTLEKIGGWTAKGYFHDGGDYWQVGRKLDLGASFTIQTVNDFVHFDQHVNNYNGAGNTFPTIFGSSEDVANIYAGATQSTLNFKCDAIVGGDWSTGTRATMNWTEGLYMTAFVDVDRTGITKGTTIPTFKAGPGTSWHSIGNRTFSWGGVPMGGSTAAKALRCMIGSVYAVRLYTRVLSPIEMKWNRFLDEARFRGLESVAATGLVEVVGSAGAGIGVDDGVYWLRDGSRTFTVPETIVRDGVTYTCAGYRLEVVDATQKNFTTQQTMVNVASRTLSADMTQNRRLVWLWQVNRLRTAADYDVGDYVQEGLVAHYDGIRNKSAAAPHDAGTKLWRDLSTHRNRAAFYGKNTTLGGWANGNAYSFNESSYAQMTNSLTLGKTLTIDMAMTIDPTTEVQAYPNYVATKGDYGIFTRSNNQRRLEWKHDQWCGGSPRPMQSNWQGRYLTALATADKTYLFQGTSYANGVARTVFSDFGTWKWSIGAAYGNDAEKRYSKGLYHGVRFYNRPLSEAELAQNRKVDEVRFRGAVVTNVVVASSNAEACGVETNGVYEVEGSWTFTVQPTVLASGKTLCPSGYTLETWSNGAWGARESYSGTNYTYTASASAAPVRLTWHFASGTLVIFR